MTDSHLAIIGALAGVWDFNRGFWGVRDGEKKEEGNG